MALSTRQTGSGAWIWVPFAIAVILIGLYTVYWFLARGFLDEQIDVWIESERANGAVIQYSKRELEGFPFRFALTLNDPVYGSPDGQTWRGQKLQLVMQPWDWFHAIARAPGRSTVSLSHQDHEEISILLGPKSAGSVRWDQTAVKQISIALDEVSLSFAGDPVADLDAFEFHLRPAPGFPEMIQLETHWQEITLGETPPGDAAVLGTVLGPSILRAELQEGVPAFNETGDPLAAIRAALNAGGTLNVPQIMLEWGPASLGAKGEVHRQDGELKGTAALRIERADDLRAALASQGLLNDDTRLAIDLLERASVNGGFFTVSLRGDGVYFLGQKQIDFPLEDYL
ncbi:MAG: DUF2125 domain-containing protein [Pseudomonadota bacterium]